MMHITHQANKLCAYGMAFYSDKRSRATAHRAHAHAAVNEHQLNSIVCYI